MRVVLKYPIHDTNQMEGLPASRMEGLPISVPPSPFLQAHGLSIATRGPRILACMSLSVPRFWVHQASWALWTLFVRWPVSWIVPETELVARMFFDI